MFGVDPLQSALINSVLLWNLRLCCFIEFKVPVLGTKVCTLKHINYFLWCNSQGGVIDRKQPVRLTSLRNFSKANFCQD